MKSGGEIGFLRGLRAVVGSFGPVRVGIGDDAAILQIPKGHEALVTTDMFLEGRHFLRGFGPWESVGHRCLARGISDIAAMGGKPVAAFLSLAMPSTEVRKRVAVDGFLAGYLGLAAGFKVQLAGGDTAEAPGKEFLADVVMVGSAPRGRALLRSGAKVGDGIFVTGSLGGSAAELAHLMRAPKRFARARAEEGHPHLFPAPRVGVGLALSRRRLASACIDVSDGLSTDLNHLCEESGVGAEIFAEAIPVHGLASLEQALHGGEDYELLFTSSSRVPAAIGGVAVTRIGTVTKRRGMRIVVGGKKVELEARGWEHFCGEWAVEVPKHVAMELRHAWGTRALFGCELTTGVRRLRSE